MRCLLAVCVAALLLLSSAWGTAEASALGTERAITDTYGVEEHPDIWEDIVVWADRSQGDTEDIYMFDLVTGVMSPLSSALGDEKRPHVFGDTVVWTQRDYRPDPITGLTIATNTIAIHTLSTKQTRWLKDAATSGFPGGAQQFPDLYGDYLVWENENALPPGDVHVFDIYLLDLRSGHVTPVTNDPAKQILPRIFGDWVLWEELNVVGGVGNNDVWAYRIGCTAAPCQWRVANATAWDENEPSVYGDTLVYADFRNDTDGRSIQDEYDNGDIYMVDLSPLRDSDPSNDYPLPATPLVVANGSQEEPRIYGNRIVWRDYAAKVIAADLWTLDLVNRIPEPLSTGGGEKWEVQIWEDRIVWSDWRFDPEPGDGIDNEDVFVFCFGQTVCGAPRAGVPILLYVTVGLLVVVAMVGVYTLKRRRPAPPQESDSAKDRRGERKSKGKGPRSKKDARTPSSRR